MVGKWHVGMGENCSHCPLAHGFDSYWGMPVTNVQACAQRSEWFTQVRPILFPALPHSVHTPTLHPPTGACLHVDAT
jgi:hypothetical protein